MKLCPIDSCDNSVLCRGVCSVHYEQARRSGTLKNHSKKKSTLDWIIENKNFDGDECLIWPYARTKAGYPNMKYKGGYKVASRVMCIIAHGEPPSEEYQAAHSCGKGRDGCINPNHLSWKTAKENEKDKNDHGTRYRGEQCSFAKLTWDIVNSMREDYKTMRNCDIAEKYGLDRRQAHKILKNKTWVSG